MSPAALAHSMLFHATMNVRIPPDANVQTIDSLSAMMYELHV
jgi:hypothetical protein